MHKKVVLITGASRGIGYELARQFAKDNYTIVAVARDETELLRLKNACPQTTVYTFVQDLKKSDAAASILDFLQKNNLTISVLVNNAGFGVWGSFLEVPLDEESELIQLSISFYLTLTKALLPDLKKSQGGILNIGSVYSFLPVPYQSVYAASKAFILSHTLALRHELMGENMHICISCPGITRTEFNPFLSTSRKPQLFSLSANEVAHISYTHFLRNKAIIIPGYTNKLFYFMCKYLPSSMMLRFIDMLNSIRHKINFQEYKEDK